MKKLVAASVLLLTLAAAGCASRAPQIYQPTPVPDVIGTAAAAQVELERAKIAMSATEKARVIPYTEQALQIQARQTAFAATSTAEYASVVRSWTPTPNYTAIVAEAQATATGERIRLDLERAKSMNMVYAMFPMIAALTALLVAAMFGVGMAKKIAAIPAPTNQKGEAVPIIVDGKFFDVLPKTPKTPEPLQLPKREPVPLLKAPEERPKIEPELDFALPSWNLVKSWDGDGGIPYGATRRGLQFINAETHPHIAAIGKTGSGKSRWFLRPFLAGALAAGRQVVIIGKSADFHVFENFQNATLITVRDFTRGEESMRYVACLRAIVEEMNRRDEYLTANHRSTWAQAGREQTYVVLDEFGNALSMMEREAREQALRYVRGIANEGRKAGLNLILASQRTVGLRDILTQVGRAVFYVEDEQESRYAIGVPGAESLKQGYFLARFGALQIVGAFQPTDDDLREFIASRNVAPLPPVEWLNVAPVENPPENQAGESEKERIRKMWAEGKSIAEIQQQVYGKMGGAYFYKTKRALEA